jgi:ParB family transcriptional regulator, chromosome partitioning protein
MLPAIGPAARHMMHLIARKGDVMSMAAPAPRSRLGRGLASLIGDPSSYQQPLPVEGEQRMVPIDHVQPSPLNPRHTFNPEELDELAASIQQRGLVQPLIVRPTGPSGPGYEIVAGERRWRACQKAGLHQIPVIVRDLQDKEVLELAIIENVQRADLNSIEEARGYRELTDRYGYSQDDLAQIIGKSRSHLANTLRLLKLPDSVQNMVLEAKLTAGHARALVGRDDAEALALRIIERGMNVREVEALVQRDESGLGGERKRREKDADTQAFEKELSEALGLKVEVKKGTGESGVLAVRYRNFDQLDYLRLRLLSEPQT